MDIGLRVSLLRPSAEFFGIAVSKADWEREGNIIWNGPGKKPTWAEIAGAADLEAAAIEKQIAISDLDASDKGMARVAEDVIGLLVSKGLIAETEIPASAKAILDKRAADREKV